MDRSDKEQYGWPDDQPISGAAFARVDSTVSCVLTRFRLRSCLSLVTFYLRFRHVRNEARKVRGLLQAVFLVEDPHTCYTLSLWKEDRAIAEFGPLRSHIRAANSAFGPTYRKELSRAEIWSVQFRLWAVSSHNLNWEGLDLKQVLDEQRNRQRTVSAQGSALKKDCV
jgi:hypothetical protein